MKIIFPTGYDATSTITAAQRDAVEKLALRIDLKQPIIVHPMLGGNGCIMIQGLSMWYGIEKDGYTHT